MSRPPPDSLGTSPTIANGRRPRPRPDRQIDAPRRRLFASPCGNRTAAAAHDAETTMKGSGALTGLLLLGRGVEAMVPWPAVRQFAKLSQEVFPPAPPWRFPLQRSGGG